MVDRFFEHPRLAEVYDVMEDDRRDLDAYVSLATELDACSVLDIGCGTGTLACRLAAQGLEVTGLDPAAASLAVADRKPWANRVRWVLGDQTMLPEMQVDLVTMTGNVAQVFLTDDEWVATLRAVNAVLRPGGWLVFETRDPARQGWREWTRAQSLRRLQLPDGDRLETWVDCTEVDLPFVSFRTTFAFESDGAVLTSDSTLRFRSRDQVETSLLHAGFRIEEVRGAPDRPGREFVFLARRHGEDR